MVDFLSSGLDWLEPELLVVDANRNETQGLILDVLESDRVVRLVREIYADMVSGAK